MSGFIAIIAVVSVLSSCWATPVIKPLSPSQPGPSIQTHSNVTRPACTTPDATNSIQNGQANKYYRWKNFNVHPDPSYSDSDRQAINNAMWYLSQALPCVNFGIWPPNSSPSGDYVRIYKGSGCWSQVGRQGGSQDMSLQSPGCMSEGTIMHEMIHALGFHHEQCREDRDDFVTIHFENVQQGKEHNFNKLTGSQWSTFGVQYNQQSIMHYNAYDFSSNGRATITAKNGKAVGSQDKLQDTDVQKLRRMYEC